MKILLVVNPVASTVAALSLETFTASCKNNLNRLQDIEYTIFVPKSARDMRDRLSRIITEEQVDRVVVCGGDGTIADTLPVLLEHPEIPLAILPVGTGNLLAMNLGIPFNVNEALKIASFGTVQEIDLACMEGRTFILDASVGIDAEIMDRTDSALKKRWGLLAYFIRGIPLLSSPPRAWLTIDVDGRRIKTRGIGVTVFNAGSIVPSGIELVPDVKPDDGILHGVIFKPKTWTDYFRGLYQLLPFTRYKNRRVLDYFAGQHIRIESKPPLKTQVDGNVMAEETPVDIEIHPKKLRVCVLPLLNKPDK